MPQVELIYDTDCPNVRGARRALLQAFVEAGLPAAWTEWNRRSPESPPYARRYGSPTILVEGLDVAGAVPADGANACRVYEHGPGVLRGVPPVGEIAAALRPHSGMHPERQGVTWLRTLAVLPSAGAALLPIGACPACWPAYAGVLGSLGLGFLFESTYRLPVVGALLAATLSALGFRAKTRRGYGPLLLGMVSVGLVLLSTLPNVFDQLAYAGLVGLVGASVWNAWPRKRNAGGSCPRCAQEQTTPGTTSAPETL